ncbi:MAG: OsmC family protein [Candidatus Thorarchaeota archaeon]|jgi:organic hydroperoxide reductase OsmC/OhrA
MPFKTKYPEKIEYNAESSWDGKTGGIAITNDDRKIVFDTPETYGGRGKGVCPDELFVSAILGCLNNTFLDFQRRFELLLIDMKLNGKATAVFNGSGYKITEITVLGQVIVEEDELETGERCVQLMKEYCHLTRSIKECIPIHFDVSVREEKSE